MNQIKSNNKIINKECGSGFTSKLEGMFKDIDISKDIMNAFNSVIFFIHFLISFFKNYIITFNLNLIEYKI